MLTPSIVKYPLSPLLTHLCYMLNYSNTKSNRLFKEYYSQRLTISPSQYPDYLHQLVSTKFSENDHRWISLAQNIQHHMHHYTIYDKVYILKSLINIHSRNALVDSLIQDLSKKVVVDRMQLEESTIFLWGLGKLKKKDKVNLLAQLFKNIKEKMRVDEDVPIVLKKNTQNQTYIQQNAISITPSTLSMLLTSMASLGIADYPLLKKIVRSAVRPNLHLFQTESLTIILLAYQKLGLNSKRDTMLVYQQIRTKTAQLQTSSFQCLYNLAQCVSTLSMRQSSQVEIQKLKKYQDEEQIRAKSAEDMKMFFLWVLETITLRQDHLICQHASILLMNSSKIKAYHHQTWKTLCSFIIKDISKAKIIDLVMTLNSLVSLAKSQRSQMQEQEQVISSRLWQLESSLSGLSLQIVADLYKAKQIRPPLKVAKMLQDYLVKLEQRAIQKREQQKSSQGRGARANDLKNDL